jgi:nicotinamide-nucleotide amidase
LTPVFPADLLGLAEALLIKARAQGLRLATAESCTGGLIAGCLTEIPGASDVVERGFVTYSDQSKIDLLGVPADVIVRYGAVSEEVARAMAKGALERAAVELALSCTGIAGPTGGSMLKPVGLVHIAAVRADRTMVHEQHRFGDIGRGAIRLRTVDAALRLLGRLL